MDGPYVGESHEEELEVAEVRAAVGPFGEVGGVETGGLGREEAVGELVLVEPTEVRIGMAVAVGEQCC